MDCPFTNASLVSSKGHGRLRGVGLGTFLSPWEFQMVEVFPEMEGDAAGSVAEDVQAASMMANSIREQKTIRLIRGFSLFTPANCMIKSAP